MKYLLFFVALLYYQKGFTQHHLAGRLITDQKKTVENANLVLYEDKTDQVIAYTASDQKGRYDLLFHSKADTVRLEINCLGFTALIYRFPNRDIFDTSFTMFLANNYLHEVEIKRKPVTVAGDTITYHANLLSDKSDRAIIDVIKKIPGIKVTESGQILFNNKAINKFYIEGKDLLNGRYSIASNNLPADAVADIQILQNHQPVKLLNGIAETDRAAINISLNNHSKLRLLGNGNVGIGFNPVLSNDALTLLKFGKKVQSINFLKFNNTGIDSDQELNSHNFSANESAGGSIPQNFISLVKPVPPPIDELKYLFNNNTTGGTNFLVAVNNLLDLRVNVAYSNNQLVENGRSLTRTVLLNDTINIDENHTGYTNYNKLYANLSLESNTKNYFLKNELKLQKIWSRSSDQIISTNINQLLANPFGNLVNDLTATIKTGSVLLGINSYTSFSHSPQQLSVTPGQFSNFLNSGDAYRSLLQEVQLKSFYTDHAISYHQQAGPLGFSVKSGVTLQLQTLANNLAIQQLDFFSDLNGQFQNSTERKRLSAYLESSVNYSKNDFKFSLALKPSLNFLKNTNKFSEEKAIKTFLNPSLNALYRINEFWNTTLSTSLSNQMSYDTNPSYILQNYRSLTNSDIPLRTSDRKNISWTLAYQNIINAVYSNLNFGYTKSNSNIINSLMFNGILTTRTAIVKNNPSRFYTLNWDISKYLVDLKTALDITFRFDNSKMQQMQQAILTEFTSNSYGVRTKVTSKIQQSIVLEHSSDYSISRTSGQSLNNTIVYQPIQILKQSVVAKYFLPAAYQTSLNLEDYYNKSGDDKGSNYFFADISLLKSLTKSKVDLSVKVSNIFNLQTYKSFVNEDNMTIASTYNLRPRMFMFSAGFQF